MDLWQRSSRLSLLVVALSLVLCRAAAANAPPFGEWHELGTPAPRLDHIAVYDSVNDRMYVFGGHPDDAWVFQFGSPGAWSPFQVPSGGPSTFQGARGVWDTKRNRALFLYLDRVPVEVWSLDFAPSPHWTKLANTGPLFLLSQESVTYDALRDRLLVFGGVNPNYPDHGNNDLLALPLGSGGSLNWQIITPPGTLPPGRVNHAAVIDVVRDRLVVFGGAAGGGEAPTFSDTWALPLNGSSSWVKLGDLGWPGHSGATASFDAAGNRMIVIGGIELGTPEYPFVAGGVFQLAFGDPNDPNATPQWTSLASGPGPDDRYGHSAVFRPAANEIDIFAGAQDWDNMRTNELWAYCLSPSPHWESRSPTSGPPAERVWQKAIFDPKLNRMVLYGGWNNTNCCDYILILTQYDYDVWNLDLTGTPRWSERDVDQYYRANHSLVFDPLRERVIAFGGQTFNYSPPPYLRNDVAVLSTLDASQWVPIVPQGTPPSPRMGHSAIYDPVADRMIVFGGSTSIYSNAPTNETWQLTLADPPTWSQLGPGGTLPTARVNHEAIYDPKRDRMLVIGGNSSQVLSLGLRPTLAWQTVTTTGATPPAFGEELSAIYDPIGDRVITFSGTSALAVWALDLSVTPPAWSKWTPAGATPPAGLDYSAVYDPIGDRAIVFGLDATSRGGNRTWALEFGRPVPALAALVSAEATSEGARVTWQLPGGAGARAEVEKKAPGSDWSAAGEIVADASGLATFMDADVRAGDRYGYRLQMSGTYAAEVWVNVPGFASLQVFGAQPNPARHLSLSFALPAQGGAGAKLLLFDLRGRLVLERSLDALGPGSHVLSIPEADGLASGVYVARLTQGESAVTKRLTLLH